MVDDNHRGWDFPGGHIEPGESPEDCFKREAQEEGYVEGKYESAQRMFVNPNDMASYYPYQSSNINVYIFYSLVF